MGVSHAEQNAEHYKLLRENPQYLYEFQMDVLREEIMMAMPVSLPVEFQVHETPIKPPSQEYLKQLRAEINHLKNRVHELEKPRIKKTTNTSLREIYDNK